MKNIKTPIADSNLLISYFTKDSNYYKAHEAINVKGCYYNEYILCETLNYIQNKFSHFHSMDAHRIMIQDRISYTFLPTYAELLQPAIEIRKKFADDHFSFTDSIILAQAEALGLTVYTSDIRMQNYKPVQVVNPFL